jgi:hypothetical protein
MIRQSNQPEVRVNVAEGYPTSSPQGVGPMADKMLVGRDRLEVYLS